jgi:hypothetical protein
MHRALTQMTATYDRVALHRELARHLARRAPMDVRVFGVDIHFKTYTGKERIDKGWNSKRRLAEKGLADVVVTDAMGRAWFREPVPAGSHLSACLGPMAEQLRVALPETTVVFVSDRGGFDFDVLEKLNAAGVKYIAWVPASVNLPDLATIAPAVDGIGGAVFEHPRMAHASRLIVQRDGDKLLPLCTNVDMSMDVVEVVETLRALRGMQEKLLQVGTAACRHRPLVRPWKGDARVRRPHHRQPGVRASEGGARAAQRDGLGDRVMSRALHPAGQVDERVRRRAPPPADHTEADP